MLSTIVNGRMSYDADFMSPIMNDSIFIACNFDQSEIHIISDKLDGDMIYITDNCIDTIEKISVVNFCNNIIADNMILKVKSIKGNKTSFKCRCNKLDIVLTEETARIKTCHFNFKVTLNKYYIQVSSIYDARCNTDQNYFSIHQR